MLPEIILVSVAAFLAGALNAVAGGGTFIAFPALIFTGIPAIAANATCTIAVWPASIASIYAFRHHLKENVAHLPWMLLLAVAGGWLGARLLLQTENATFEYLVPWLLLIATGLLAYGRKMALWLAITLKDSLWLGRFRLILAVVLLILTAIYGGFFGAGIGILTLAMLYVLGMEDVHRMNALKTIIAAAINSAAFFTFAFSELVVWDKALPMMIAAIAGGYIGAWYSLKLPQERVRQCVLLIAITMTLYFFVDVYG